MRETIARAMEMISTMFPLQSAVIEDGGEDYYVGVVENDEHEPTASFRLIVDTLSQDEQICVTEIQVGAIGKYCGTVEAGEMTNQPSMKSVVPIQITRIGADGSSAWGIVGDYEVAIDTRTLR